MRTFASIVLIAGAIALFGGCGEKEPLTILFTGDDQGRLVPSG